MSSPVLAHGDELATVWHGDALEVLRGMGDSTVHAVICDPPYGLAPLPAAKVADTVARWVTGERAFVPDGRGFMSTRWDRFVPPPALWDEVSRVLVPGGHLLCFAAPRTVDLMGLSVRLAGFELRDELLAWVFGKGMAKAVDVSELIDTEQGNTRPVVGVDSKRARRLGAQGGDYATDAGWNMSGRRAHVTAPATEQSAAWAGWAAGLKPAHEPVLVARKPLDGTLAGNVLEHGAGALHIDATRIPFTSARDAADNAGDDGAGRWPANVLASHHPACTPHGCDPGCQVAELAAQSADRRGRGDATRFIPTFRYAPKATAVERPVVDGVTHPSVKPLSVIRWLVDLVAVPGMTVLDPFAGSGPVAEACTAAGVASVSIELDGRFVPLILRRLERARGEVAA